MGQLIPPGILWWCQQPWWTFLHMQVFVQYVAWWGGGVHACLCHLNSCCVGIWRGMIRAVQLSCQSVRLLGRVTDQTPYVAPARTILQVTAQDVCSSGLHAVNLYFNMQPRMRRIGNAQARDCWHADDVHQLSKECVSLCQVSSPVQEGFIPPPDCLASLLACSTFRLCGNKVVLKEHR